MKKKDPSSTLSPANNRITCVINVHNGEEYLEETIFSLLGQTLGLKILVVDNCSKDKTPEIAQNFPQIEYVRTKKFLSLGGARNYALDFVKTDYLIFVDSDDLLLPDACRQFNEAINNFPFVGLINGGVIFVNSKKKPHPIWKQTQLHSLGAPPLNPQHTSYLQGETASDLLKHLQPRWGWVSCVFLKQAILDVNGFDLKYQYAADLNLISKIVVRHSSVSLRTNTALYRIHGNSISTAFGYQTKYQESLWAYTQCMAQWSGGSRAGHKRVQAVYSFKIAMAEFHIDSSIANGLRVGTAAASLDVIRWGYHILLKTFTRNIVLALKYNKQMTNIRNEVASLH